MQISEAAWTEYIQKMRKISNDAAEKMRKFIRLHGYKDNKAILDYAVALSTYYGEAIGALSCEMYDRTAEAQEIILKPAEPAQVPDYGEVARAINGTSKFSKKMIPETVGRLIKQTGADTTLQNARRDGAQFAWIPHGDTCAYCFMIAAAGWRYMSRDALKNGHAEHIHPNCDCNYSVRFDGKSTVEGYDPEKMSRIFDKIAGNTPEEKVKEWRRTFGAGEALTINQIEFIIDVTDDKKILGERTPAEWKRFLEELGFDVTPLGKGNLENVPFESGGGFRIHYGGDGYFQYHPDGFHHGEEYYKISNGKDGTERFDMKGVKIGE